MTNQPFITMSITKQQIQQIKKAIDIELSNSCIDFPGKRSSFSVFITKFAREMYKVPPKDKRWADMVLHFSNYNTMSVAERINSIRKLECLISKLNTAPVNHLSLIKKDEQAPPTYQDTDVPRKYTSLDEIDVMYVKGVGPVIANKLNALRIFTVEDLLNYYPREHIDFKTQYNIEDIDVGEVVTIFGVVKRVNNFISKRNAKLAITNLTICDDTGCVAVSWFYSATNKHLFNLNRGKYQKGMQVMVSGMVKYDRYARCKAIDKAEIEIIYDSEEDIESLHAGRIVPIYSLTEGLRLKTLRNAINNALTTYDHLITETIPQNMRSQYGLAEKEYALKNIHFPESMEDMEFARHRLIFEEFFIHQLNLAMVRKEVKNHHDALKIEPKKGGLVEKFLKNLPFTLTGAQDRSFKEILTDLASPEPMHRLLQGDVGSGKTVVACLTLLTAVENGFQGAIMAPTEVLAEQHYKKFQEWLTPLGLSVGIFLGKHGVRQKRTMKANLESGQTHIAVGTHALIQEDVTFSNLGLVVIDEQHRFGVKQRTALKSKGNNPELLTMTATPIPRTLSLTMYGDLDVSIIDEMPQGRKPIKTFAVGPSGRREAYNLIKREIANGHQAFIVFPLIEESEKLAAKAATQEAEKLKEGVFKDYSIGLVHGKLKNADKEQAMEDFRAGKYDILVATTVIEVGVDIPNATVMMIENADRFGLAQLHQLRGRVGRSDLQSYCILVSNSKSEDSLKRLSIMEETNNGFIISEFDLSIRGPGEFVGVRQSGIPDFMLANITEHTHILELAREAAMDIVMNDKMDQAAEIIERLKGRFTETFELLSSG